MRTRTRWALKVNPRASPHSPWPRSPWRTSAHRSTPWSKMNRRSWSKKRTELIQIGKDYQIKNKRLMIRSNEQRTAMWEQIPNSRHMVAVREPDKLSIDLFYEHQRRGHQPKRQAGAKKQPTLTTQKFFISTCKSELMEVSFCKKKKKNAERKKGKHRDKERFMGMWMHPGSDCNMRAIDQKICMDGYLDLVIFRHKLGTVNRPNLLYRWPMEWLIFQPRSSSWSSRSRHESRTQWKSVSQLCKINKA